MRRSPWMLTLIGLCALGVVLLALVALRSHGPTRGHRGTPGKPGVTVTARPSVKPKHPRVTVTTTAKATATAPPPVVVSPHPRITVTHTAKPKPRVTVTRTTHPTRNPSPTPDPVASCVKNLLSLQPCHR